MLDIERAISANLGLGLFARVFASAKQDFPAHVIATIRTGFALNKSLYSQNLKTFTHLRLQTAHSSAGASGSGAGSGTKENLPQFPLQTPKKRPSIALNPRSERLKHSHSLTSEKGLRGPGRRMRSALSQKGPNRGKAEKDRDCSLSLASEVHLQSESGRRLDRDKHDGIVSLLTFRRRKVLNDVLIASFGQAVHCAIRRGLMHDRKQAFRLLGEWMSGLPLNNQPALNRSQLDLAVDLCLFLGRPLSNPRPKQLVRRIRGPGAGIRQLLRLARDADRARALGPPDRHHSQARLD